MCIIRHSASAEKTECGARPIAMPLLATLGIVMLLLAAPGCAGPARTAGDGSRTGGIALDLLIEREDGSRAFYRVFPDGTLGYAGGNDARARRITWTGAMSSDQIEQLADLITTHGWREREPAAGENPNDVTYRIDLRGPDGRHRYRVDGDSPAVLPVYNYLREIAMQRFEHIIETLPQPSGESATP